MYYTFEIRPPRGNNILETRDGSYNDKTVSHFNPSERNIIISVEPRRSYLFIERYILLSRGILSRKNDSFRNKIHVPRFSCIVFFLNIVDIVDFSFR